MRPNTPTRYGLTALLVMLPAWTTADVATESYVEPNLPEAKVAVFKSPRNILAIDGQPLTLTPRQRFAGPFSKHTLKLLPGQHTLLAHFHVDDSSKIQWIEFTFVAQAGHVYSSAGSLRVPPVSIVDKTTKEVVVWVWTRAEPSVTSFKDAGVTATTEEGVITKEYLDWVRTLAKDQRPVAVSVTDRATVLKQLGKPEQASADERLFLYRRLHPKSRAEFPGYLIRLEFDNAGVLHRIRGRPCISKKKDRVCHAKNPLCAMLKEEKEKTFFKTYCPA